MFSKLSTTVVLLLVLVNLAFSAVSRSQPSVHPDHPGKCWDEDTKSVHVVGDVFTVPKCTRVTCLGDLSFERASCGFIGAVPPCRVVDGDLSLPYPNCCDNVKCD